MTSCWRLLNSSSLDDVNNDCADETGEAEREKSESTDIAMSSILSRRCLWLCNSCVSKKQDISARTIHGSQSLLVHPNIYIVFVRSPGKLVYHFVYFQVVLHCQGQMSGGTAT